MIPKVIYLDADDTLLGWSEEMMFRLAGHRDISGITSHFDYSQFAGATSEDISKIMEDPGFWESLQLTEQGKELLDVVNDLAQPAMIVTSTPPPSMSLKAHKIAAMSKSLLTKKLNLPVAILSEANLKEWKSAKAKYAWNGAILVDDNELIINSFVEAGGQALLIPKPWNQATGNIADLLKFMCEPIQGVDEKEKFLS